MTTPINDDCLSQDKQNRPDDFERPMGLLASVLQHGECGVQQGTSPNTRVNWRYLGQGILELIPPDCHASLVLSAGIHGNETAPIEMLDWLSCQLLLGCIPLKVRLLLVLGNPKAIRLGVRYINHDLNRLFATHERQQKSTQPKQSCVLTSHAKDGTNKAADQTNDDADEIQRAVELKEQVQAFFARGDETQHELSRYHYDLHTAIHPSLMPTFALLPALPNQNLPNKSHELGAWLKQQHHKMLSTLTAAQIDAVVYHTEQSTTFTNFSQDQCQATSVTLELGKALPFGENDLTQFLPCQQMLISLISQCPMPMRQKPIMRHFIVDKILIKHDDDFELLVDDKLANFSLIPVGTVIAKQSIQEYDNKADNQWSKQDGTEQKMIYRTPKPYYSLFLNAKVKKGLRAGMLLQEIED